MAKEEKIDTFEVVRPITTTTTLHKFTVYVWGFNDHINSTPAEAEEEIACTKWDYIIKPFHEGTVDIGTEVYDDHPLNQDPPKEVWEQFMDNELNRLVENKKKADEQLQKYMKEKFK